MWKSLQHFFINKTSFLLYLHSLSFEKDAGSIYTHLNKLDMFHKEKTISQQVRKFINEIIFFSLVIILVTVQCTIKLATVLRCTNTQTHTQRKKYAQHLWRKVLYFPVSRAQFLSWNTFKEFAMGPWGWILEFLLACANRRRMLSMPEFMMLCKFFRFIRRKKKLHS